MTKKSSAKKQYEWYEKETKNMVVGIIAEMKEKIPKHPVLKKTLENLMAEGLSEDEALNIMIDAWLEGI